MTKQYIREVLDWDVDFTLKQDLIEILLDYDDDKEENEVQPTLIEQIKKAQAEQVPQPSFPDPVDSRRVQPWKTPPYPVVDEYQPYKVYFGSPTTVHNTVAESGPTIDVSAVPSDYRDSVHKALASMLSRYQA